MSVEAESVERVLAARVARWSSRRGKVLQRLTALFSMGASLMAGRLLRAMLGGSPTASAAYVHRVVATSSVVGAAFVVAAMVSYHFSIRDSHRP